MKSVGLRRKMVPLVLISGLALLLFANLGDLSHFFKSSRKSYPTGNTLKVAQYNYQQEISKHATELNLPPEYFLALAVLECSGQKPAGERFESHVFKKLKQVREGSRSRFENVTQADLIDASDEALRNLATSWGPFQLMGYKCIGLDVNIKDIRGDDAVYWGMKWVDIEYGKQLRKGKFKDAFHLHNTGRKYPIVGGPKTHDPKYVDRGLAYVDYFKTPEGA
jgi:hypothetical protein